MPERFELLEGFEFGSCHVRNRSIIGFTAQTWPDSDPLEQRETAVFFYYPDKPPERMWAAVGIGAATGVHGCAAFLPEERWVFVTDDGEVFVVGGGSAGFEERIPVDPRFYFSNVKSISKGHAVAVGPRRKIFSRLAANRWVRLDRGLFPEGDRTPLEYSGFNDVAGFSEEDMYACGGRGDLWHYDGERWTVVDLPTNAVLENLCCSTDGLVHITTNRREIVKGRGAIWELVEQKETDEQLEAVVEYNGEILVSTVSELYSVRSDGFRVAQLGVPELKSKAHLAAADGVLVVAGTDEAAMFDGVSWRVILESVS